MPHVTVSTLEPQLAGRENELIARLTGAVVSVYGEQIRQHVAVQLIGLPIGRWALGGVPLAEVAPLVTLAIRERALTRPDGEHVAAALAAAVTDALVEVFGEIHRAGTLVDLLARADDHVAIGGRLVGERTAVEDRQGI